MESRSHSRPNSSSVVLNNNNDDNNPNINPPRPRPPTSLWYRLSFGLIIFSTLVAIWTTSQFLQPSTRKQPKSSSSPKEKLGGGVDVGKNANANSLDEDQILANRIFAKDSIISPTDPRVLAWLNKYRIYPPIPHMDEEDEYQDGGQGFQKNKRMKTGWILKWLKQKRNGFYVESGARFGSLYYSLILELEEKYDWSGLLIEPSSHLFEQLLIYGHNAWSSHSCLSSGKVERKEFIIDSDKSKSWKVKEPILKKSDDDLESKISSNVRIVECFPLQTYLGILKRKSVDFFALDVEDEEFSILQGIPFNDFDIKMIILQHSGGSSTSSKGKKAEILSFMKHNGYKLLEQSKDGDLLFEKITNPHKIKMEIK